MLPEMIIIVEEQNDVSWLLAGVVAQPQWISEAMTSFGPPIQSMHGLVNLEKLRTHKLIHHTFADYPQFEEGQFVLALGQHVEGSEGFNATSLRPVGQKDMDPEEGLRYNCHNNNGLN